ncbi:hypothetical protein K503DRAFT_636531 [Rhizopogon vinicolor AM-OR11-026]|uniref:Uncharacterized protein n=1 Tax=Rhizopogon vinicolor AM-OR11-026 TaxID=1314800 RepID=A0A1B7N5U4_9AGAM|nr:hypothetical protein K503DRAFT_636531 [Rhizopogon vinicolor AM-OR11-026]
MACWSITVCTRMNFLRHLTHRSDKLQLPINTKVTLPLLVQRKLDEDECTCYCEGEGYFCSRFIFH